MHTAIFVSLGMKIMKCASIKPPFLRRPLLSLRFNISQGGSWGLFLSKGCSVFGRFTFKANENAS